MSSYHRHGTTGKYAVAGDVDASITDLQKKVADLTSKVAALEQPPTIPPPTTPPPTGTALQYVATPVMPLPSYLIPTTDLTWGTKITRVSNIAGLRHAYARIQPWNCDGTKILLGFTPSSARMIDGNTYADLYAFHPVPYAIWSNKDPNLFYGAQGNALVKQNATTGVITTIKDFGGTVSIGNYEGGISDDDRFIALSYNILLGAKLAVYDLVSNVIAAETSLPSGLDNFQISRDGNAVVVVGNGTTKAYPRSLSSAITLYLYANHGDNWLNGQFLANSTGAGVKSFNTGTGLGTTLIPEGSAFGYGHSSGRGPLPVFSNYDTQLTIGKPGHDQIISVNADGTVNVYGFAHHTTAQDNSAAAYLSQPHACPSRDGRRAIFASDWGGGSVYAYVAELP